MLKRQKRTQKEIFGSVRNGTQVLVVLCCAVMKCLYCSVLYFTVYFSVLYTVLISIVLYCAVFDVLFLPKYFECTR